MLVVKRSVIAAVVLALALSGGIVVNAATSSEDRVMPQQSEGTAWLGVSIVETGDGVMINEVAPEFPADDAGLQHGDFITAVDDTAIESAELLIETIQAHAPGDEIEVIYMRGDESDTVAVTLGERPTVMRQPIRPAGPNGEAFGMLNMFGLNLEFSEDGLLVESINADSPFADSGLQAGDLITAIDGELVVGEFLPHGLVMSLGSDEPVMFTIVRDGEEMDIEVTIELPDMPMMPEVFGPDFDLQIQPFRDVRPTQLGVQFVTINAEVVEDEALDVDQGALIKEVFDDTPAAAAGLEVSDVIVAVDGDAVDEERTLADRLYAYEEGDVVTFTVLRAGEEIELEAELGPRNRDMRFSGPVQVMPMQPSQGGAFGFGPHMGQQFFFGPHHGGRFEMRPCDGHGFFEFDFDHPRFWDSEDDAGNGADSGDDAADAVDTSASTPM